MKTRTTRLTLSHSEGIFEVEIADEGTGEYVLVSCGLDRPPFEQSISIGPSEWPFLRDAIDRMFEEIAENEGEGKLKKLLETPAPWEKASEEQAPPACDDGWIPWNGGECPKGLENRWVRVRLRGFSDDDTGSDEPCLGSEWDWSWEARMGDIIAYKVVG